MGGMLVEQKVYKPYSFKEVDEICHRKRHIGDALTEKEWKEIGTIMLMCYFMMEEKESDG